MMALAVSAGWGQSQKQRRVLQRLVREAVAASWTEAEVLRFLEGIRHQMRPDLPPLDEQIDTMLAQSGMKARLAVVAQTNTQSETE
jgi:hypothetical protein